MKERFWAVLIATLMLLFWAFALAGPVTSDKARSHYTLLSCEPGGPGVCVGGR